MATDRIGNNYDERIALPSTTLPPSPPPAQPPLPSESSSPAGVSAASPQDVKRVKEECMVTGERGESSLSTYQLQQTLSKDLEKEQNPSPASASSVSSNPLLDRPLDGCIDSTIVSGLRESLSEMWKECRPDRLQKLASDFLFSDDFVEPKVERLSPDQAVPYHHEELSFVPLTAWEYETLPIELLLLRVGGDQLLLLAKERNLRAQNQMALRREFMAWVHETSRSIREGTKKMEVYTQGAAGVGSIAAMTLPSLVSPNMSRLLYRSPLGGVVGLFLPRPGDRRGLTKMADQVRQFCNMVPQLGSTQGQVAEKRGQAEQTIDQGLSSKLSEEARAEGDHYSQIDQEITRSMQMRKQFTDSILQTQSALHR